MYRTGIANLPLHLGKCPKWLFPRMVKLSKEISKAIILEYSEEEFLERLSNPYFFQALGCVVGFDWHSSGLTTTTCGALKEALNKEDFGVKIAGGKGSTSKRTPEEIKSLTQANVDRLVYASKMSAKVDNTLVQDNYQLYHHIIIFSEEGSWAVIQQGLNIENRYARRYHWLSTASRKLANYVEEPHNAICCDALGHTLDLTSTRSNEARKISLDLVKDNPQHIKNYSRHKRLMNYNLPRNHKIQEMNKRNLLTLQRAYEIQPKTYEELISIRGIGPKTVRALALIANLIYGAELSWKDPAKFSFAHGGKDGIPYPVDRALMDQSIKILREALEDSSIGAKEKINALKRLKLMLH